MQLRYSGERYLSEAPGKSIHYEHLHRYAFAKYFAKGKKVIDIACGEGYGSYLLAEMAEDVTALDIDEATIAHAAHKYKKGNLKFLQGSMTELPFKTKECFDLAVCMEGIEHTKQQSKVFDQISKVLKKEGILIISTPNITAYKKHDGNKNPFHEKELSRIELEDLL
ncbi:MAG: class I SAM-dependent methyltransferase, partial [Candidatus Omnitrophica bacterium]|nr:class I SAM-dependent methyltransferase [Candidatus Omnitrophota bacterium]